MSLHLFLIPLPQSWMLWASITSWYFYAELDSHSLNHTPSASVKKGDTKAYGLPFSLPMSELDEQITQCRNQLQRCTLPLGHSDRVDLLHNLSFLLRRRFGQAGEMADLDEALSCGRVALENCPNGHPGRPISLEIVAIHLHTRFERLGKPSDIDEALALQRAASELWPEGRTDRAVSLSALATYLHTRFLQLGKLSDLDEALVIGRTALELCPEGHPYRANSLERLAAYLRTRFEQLGWSSDVEEALALARSALELCSHGHPHRAVSLGNVAAQLYLRFQQLGKLSDLEEALTLARSALDLWPQGDADQAPLLNNMAHFLHARFEHLGRMSDLHEALSFQRAALEFQPQGCADRAISLGNVARYTYIRFKQLGRLSDLEEVLSFQRGALELRSEGHPQRAISLGNIANLLHFRFEKQGELSDLDEALAIQRSALELRPQGHPHRVFSLGNIANYLHARFGQLGRLSDLDEALAVQRSALELRPQGHPHRSWSLACLARYLHTRFEHSAVHDTSDLQEIFSLYSQLSSVSHTASHVDLLSVKQWIQRAEQYRHSTTILAYQTFFCLCVRHLASLPLVPQNLGQLKRLMKYLAVDAFSACLRHGNLNGAIELLEQGRGVFWGQLMRLRSPIDEVMASGDEGKKLADKFTQLTSLLRSVLDSSFDSQSQHGLASQLNSQLQDVIAEIRKLPGLSRFFQSPLFSDLRVAAAGGPVIIVNASQYTCDALVLLSNQDPIHIPLPITKARISELSLELRSLTSCVKFRDITRDLLILLRKLWDAVVFPIVEVLQNFHPRRSRIWWCTTAEFSLLPLHAAGTYRKGQLNLSDLYISSYTPTLSALARAQQMRRSNSPVEHRLLVVGQAHAPGQNKLVSVETELSSVLQCVGSTMTVTCVRDQDANVAKVSQELNKHEFLHLACHGIPDRKRPFESGFALGDGLLKVDNIMRYDLQNAQFAYLSACHTTAGDEQSPDEVIHLAAAMQFAGFRSVIGTMWAVDDAYTNEITSRFYENMMDESGRLDYTRAAVALHRTMRSIRSSDIPFDQRILYVHIGV